MDDLLPFILIGSILEASRQTVITIDVSKNFLLVVSRRSTRRRRFGSLTSLFSPPPAVAWISGRDPLLVVSIVMSGVFPKLDFACFSFLHHHDISIIASHVFVRKIIFIKLYFYFSKICRKRFLSRQSSPFSKINC